MSTPLTIVAIIQAKPDKQALIKAELEKLIEPTTGEAGCLQYELHQDNERPEQFLFYESWASRNLWQQHMNSDHIQRYLQATEGAVAHFSIMEMTQVKSYR
ncbi:putative quinol monooxygenase [Spartinivicinus poritis]|uniref:Quinol monooxygenase n=1 Tax=Spartinivicinus poritis TaxID=2994640 RepID=A0ABT5U780_9GAMM|nr:putative quinol monooxygenase [Spartinivicinus sp. A2-2]MDE1462221.1 putative quinol monooxygenase [Spartinivicinus sp. A2-2]